MLPWGSRPSARLPTHAAVRSATIQLPGYDTMNAERRYSAGDAS